MKILSMICTFTLLFSSSIMFKENNCCKINSNNYIELEKTNDEVERVLTSQQSRSSYNYVSYNFVSKTLSYNTFSIPVTASLDNVNQGEKTEPVIFDEVEFSEDDANTIMPRYSDNRTKVTTVSGIRKAVGQVVSKFGPYKNNVDEQNYYIFTFGTCFMEGMNVLLTNAHVIYGDLTIGDFDDGINNPSFPSSITVYMGINGVKRENYTGPISTIDVAHIHAEYIADNDENYNFDWAVLESNDDELGLKTGGWFGKAWTSGSISKEDIQTDGYPGDLAEDGKPVMYTSTEKVKSSATYTLKTECYSSNGQSGSPYHRQGIVYGILAFSETTLWWQSASGGPRITQWLDEFLQRYV